MVVVGLRRVRDRLRGIRRRRWRHLYVHGRACSIEIRSPDGIVGVGADRAGDEPGAREVRRRWTSPDGTRDLAPSRTQRRAPS